MKKREGLKEKETQWELKIFIKNSKISIEISILCNIWVELQVITSQNNKSTNKIHIFVHFFCTEGGWQYWPLQFTIIFFTMYGGRGGPKGNSAKFIIFTVYFFWKLPLQNNALILLNVLISSGQQEHTWQIQVDCDDKKQLTL